MVCRRGEPQPDAAVRAALVAVGRVVDAMMMVRAEQRAVREIGLPAA